MTSEQPESLRARQIRERREAIHSAAVDLVLEHGLDNVTVAQIAEAAQVSNRTFFNYFASKELAIVGLNDSAAVADDLRDFIADYEPRRERLAEDLAFAIRAAFDFLVPPSSSKHKVRLVQTRYPHLAMLSMETMRQYDEQIIAGVRKRLERRGTTFPNEEEAAPTSRMLAQLCSVPIQHAFRSAKFDSNMELSGERIDEAFATSVELFLTVLERLK